MLELVKRVPTKIRYSYINFNISNKYKIPTRIFKSISKYLNPLSFSYQYNANYFSIE